MDMLIKNYINDFTYLKTELNIEDLKSVLLISIVFIFTMIFNKYILSVIIFVGLTILEVRNEEYINYGF